MRVGDYVRTKKGIAKIIDRINDPTNYYDKFWVCDRYLELNDDTEYIHEQDIIGEPSKNPIDLIEVGDYVNGYEVMEPKYHYMGNNFIDFDKEIDAGSGYGCQLLEKDIKTIITKEQFSSMEYKVESEVK